ncbi:MAG: hypothetical protein V4857_10880 [Pseudomonadota bacterium]
MSTFLIIVLSVVLVLLALILLVLNWLRRKVRKYVSQYKVLAPFLMAESARIKLRVQALPPASGDEADADDEEALLYAEMNRMWAQLSAQGVRQIGSFASDVDDAWYLAGQHPDNNIVAMVVSKNNKAPFLEFMSVSEANTVVVLSGALAARPLQLPSLSIAPHTASTVDAAAKAMASAPSGRALDTRRLILVIERVHAARLDSQLMRAPTLADMQAHATLHGVTDTLDDAMRERALEMNRDAWLDAVRVSLLDNAMRKLKLEQDSWERLEGDAIVIHQGMNADEVIATLTQHDLVGRLGEQLKRQQFGPAQIFDEINRRLPPGEQRKLVISLGIPVQGRLFASTGVLQAAGVVPDMVAA